MVDWLIANDFKDLTFFGQDWGGLIGLRMVAREPDRFIGVSMGNTGLPITPMCQDVIDEVKRFRASDERLTVFTMSKQIGRWIRVQHPR